MIQRDPGFQAFLREVANEWLSRLGANESPSQLELRVIAQAQIVLDDFEGALRSIERALEVGGPIDDEVREDRERLRRALRLRASRPQR